MDPLTSEWVEKAEGDWAVVEALTSLGDARFTDGICFHAQQCAEKYLKALLQEEALPVPRTHDLAHLIELLAEACPGLVEYREAAAWLTACAVEIRYPGVSAAGETATEAVRYGEQMRAAARERLGL